MGNFKEIETGFKHMFFPNGVEQRSIHCRRYINHIKFMYFFKYDIPIPPYPHPQCGNKNPAYGKFSWFEHNFDDFQWLYLKMKKPYQTADTLKNK